MSEGAHLSVGMPEGANICMCECQRMSACLRVCMVGSVSALSGMNRGPPSSTCCSPNLHWDGNQLQVKS